MTELNFEYRKQRNFQICCRKWSRFFFFSNKSFEKLNLFLAIMGSRHWDHYHNIWTLCGMGHLSIGFLVTETVVMTTMDYLGHLRWLPWKYWILSNRDGHHDNNGLFETAKMVALETLDPYRQGWPLWQQWTIWNSWGGCPGNIESLATGMVTLIWWQWTIWDSWDGCHGNIGSSVTDNKIRNFGTTDMVAMTTLY